MRNKLSVMALVLGLVLLIVSALLPVFIIGLETGMGIIGGADWPMWALVFRKSAAVWLARFGAILLLGGGISLLFAKK